jgi:anti-sigma regulatory factor (Ser/Thr protein kinase)
MPVGCPSSPRTVPGAAGKAGAVMAGPVVRETVTLAGRAKRARVARACVAGVLGSGHPCGEDTALLVSDLFGNSVLHSGSGVPGETVTVAVRAGEGLVRVEVTDRSGPGVPGLSRAVRDGRAAGGFRSSRACLRGGGGAAGGR